MAAARYAHTATLLPDGKVLVAGGTGWTAESAFIFSSAELYDPATGTFSATGSMAAGRAGHTATRLPGGKVLVAGGTGSTGYPQIIHSSAELYDPSTGTFAATGSMTTRRSSHTATLLADGRVLVAGGTTAGGKSSSSAELYDPSTGTWSPTGPLSTARHVHAATLLADGKVLVTGGALVVDPPYGTYLASTELYDPAAGTFKPGSPMSGERRDHTATRLPSGKVLILGGGIGIGEAELYDPAAGTFAATVPPRSTRRYHTATLLPNGKVLVAGAGGPWLAEVYDPGTATWSPTEAMAGVRTHHKATALQDGKVLVTGGISGYAPIPWAEVYDPGARPGFVATASMGASRMNHSAIRRSDGKVVVLGGYVGAGSLGGGTGPNNDYTDRVEVYDPGTGTWSLTNSWCRKRYEFQATPMPDNTVLVTGGANYDLAYQSELYDLSTDSWSLTGRMTTVRHGHTATLLPDGKVLVAGGRDNSGPVDVYLFTAELYDPSAPSGSPVRKGAWSATGSMAAERLLHTATLLPDGKVLVAGGWGVERDSQSTAELYDPAKGTWKATGSMANNRYGHTATLLPDGKVLVAGGAYLGGTGFQSSAELYDPATGTFTATGSMATPRTRHAATLLPDGKVLVTGGVPWVNGESASAELYDPATGTWSSKGSMTVMRASHTATLLSSGNLLLVGGGSATADLFLAQ